ncbi:hypothetical protein AALC25_11425 [Lachnospiraceae bacterium 29-84]
MNKVIQELYEIEAQAGEIMQGAGMRQKVIQEENRKKMEEISLGLKGEMEGRLTILKTQLEEQKARELAQVEERNKKQIEEIERSYRQDLDKLAREIVARITRV